MSKEDFIKNIVIGWMKNDLIRMTENIKPTESVGGNINFPLALCTLSYMECLGGYLLGTDLSFEDNVEKYISDCFSNPSEYNVLILKDFVRNGLAHDYLPRCGVSRNGKHPAIYKGKTYDLVLDAETLVTDFIDSLGTFVTTLEEDKYITRVKEASDKMAKLILKNKIYFDKLTEQPDDDIPTTPSSGPSGPAGPTR